MEMESRHHEKARLFYRGWSLLKAIANKFKDTVVGVGQKTKKLGQDDPRRVIHSVKVGLALTFVSLIYYLRPLYNGFEESGVWAVITVVVVFEFTVGATLGKCLNRGFATFLAVAFGVGAYQLANLSGEKAEAIILGLFVFLLAVASTFSRFFPGIKQRYDYGVLIFILTFSMVSVSGYRLENILELVHQRLSTILIGAFSSVIISIIIYPVWAGEDLHNLVALNVEKLATFLEGFGVEYFRSPDEEVSIVVSKNEMSFSQGYKSILNSKATEESFANFARWEPGHGLFRFRHPWKQYLQIGSLTRQCAYLVEALNGYLNSEIQAPPEFLQKIQEPCMKMSSESGLALKKLASGIREMTQPSLADPHVANSKTAANDLKATLKTALMENSDLLAIIPAATVASLLIEIVVCTEKIAESVHELAKITHFKSVSPTVTPQLLYRGAIKPNPNSDAPHVVITVSQSSSILPEHENPQPHMTGHHEEM